MKRRLWNIRNVQRVFRDPNANGGHGTDFTEVQSLKDALRNPDGMRFGDVLKIAVEGLVMVMDAIEREDQLNSVDNPPEDPKP